MKRVTSLVKAMIDELGDVKAQVAELTAKETTLKNRLIGLVGENEQAEGDRFRVAIVTTDRRQLDMEAVRAKLSPQFLAAHTLVTPVTRVEVKARRRDQVVGAS